MFVKFNIECKNPKKLAEVLIRDGKPWKSTESFFVHVSDLNENTIIGELHFPNDYNSSDSWLKLRTEDIIKSVLYSYSFVNNEKYKLNVLE